jgi:hypothetical protein
MTPLAHPWHALCLAARSAAGLTREHAAGLDTAQTMWDRIRIVRFGDLDMVSVPEMKPLEFLRRGVCCPKQSSTRDAHPARIAHARVTPLRKRSRGFSFGASACDPVLGHMPGDLFMGSVSHGSRGQHDVPKRRCSDGVQPAVPDHKCLRSGSVRSRTDTRVMPLNGGTGRYTAPRSTPAPETKGAAGGLLPSLPRRSNERVVKDWDRVVGTYQRLQSPLKSSGFDGWCLVSGQEETQRTAGTSQPLH